MAGSRGLVKALGKIKSTHITWVYTRLRIPGSHRLLNVALRLFPKTWNDFWITLFFHIDEQPTGAPDIICSAGRKTQYLNVLWARKYAAKNFFVGTLRDLSYKNFTAFLTSLNIDAPNHIRLGLPLTDIDQDALADATPTIALPKTDKPIWTLLVGGPTKGYPFKKQDWLDLAKAMTQLSQKYGGKWLLTTSRRTGKGVEDILKSAVSPTHILDGVWYAEAPRKVVKPFLASADAVFCTEDSMAMLGEAVSAGRPVYSLTPKAVHLDWKERQIVTQLEAGKKISRHKISELAENGASLPPKTAFDLYSASPLDEVAHKLRWFLEN